MLQTTQDILDIAKAFGIIWVSLFFGIMFFYTAMMIRQFYMIMRSTRSRLKKIDGIIKQCHAKMGASATGFVYLMEGVKIIAQAIKKQKSTKVSEKNKIKKSKKSV